MAEDKIRVVLVDDSAVIRGLITRILQEDPGIEVVGSFPNGLMGVQGAEKYKPDVVILDIEMPVMDGITALPKILAASPDTRVLMCSTLTMRNAEMTLKAMSLGATDCIAKPTSTSEISGENTFKAHLVALVKSVVKRTRAAPKPATTTNTTSSAPKIYADAKITLRPASEIYQGKPSIVAIGSSTGGPQALFAVLKHCVGFDVPIVITQHMPPTFTTILAQHITTNTNLQTYEAAQGMLIEKGCAYIAPGGFHMEIQKTEDGSLKAHLTTEPPENFCRPSVEPMMRSVTKLFGQKTLAVILTGMGQDGVNSCKVLSQAGGKVIAQNEATSVVWGMPGAVATAGVCSAVLPVEDIGPTIRRIMMKA